MGCLRTVGCFTLLVVGAAIAWFFRASWLPLVERPLREAVSGGAVAPPSKPSSDAAVKPAAAEPRWEPVTAEGTSRARDAVQSLDRRAGPVFANLAPGDLAGYVYQQLAKELPPSAANVEAAAAGEQLWVRADVKLSDFGGAKELGPLAGMLGDRERVEFGGTLDVVRPGLAEFRVRSLRIKELVVPSALIPRLMARIARGPRPAGVAVDALPLELPTYIADVRIRRDKITLYKAIP